MQGGTDRQSHLDSTSATLLRHLQSRRARSPSRVTVCNASPMMPCLLQSHHLQDEGHAGSSCPSPSSAPASVLVVSGHAPGPKLHSDGTRPHTSCTSAVTALRASSHQGLRGCPSTRHENPLIRENSVRPCSTSRPPLARLAGRPVSRMSSHQADTVSTLSLSTSEQTPSQLTAAAPRAWLRLAAGAGSLCDRNL